MSGLNNRLPLAIAFALGTSGLAAAQPGSVPGQLAETEYGPMLVSASGMALYFSTSDDMAQGKSDCTDATPPTTMPDPTAGLGRYNINGYKFFKSCLQLWKPYVAPADAQADGDWSIFNRPEGTRQWAWQGKPLYFSVRDSAPGDKNGVNPDFGGTGPLGRAGGGGGQRNIGPTFRYAGYAPFPRLPMGIKVLRHGNDLVLANAGDKPLYAPRGAARLQRVCLDCADLQPIEAAALSQLKDDWSVLDAGAGRQQLAWKGKALFNASPNQTEADIARAGFGLVVYRKLPAPPPEIGVQMSVVGPVYTDKAGKTLYTFACTTPGCDLPGGAASAMSALCSTGEECMRRWRPYLARPGARRSGEWSVMDVPQPMFTSAEGELYPSGGRTVKGWAYRGKPVFTYHMDTEPGEVWGNTVRWFNAPPSFQSIRVPVVISGP